MKTKKLDELAIEHENQIKRKTDEYAKVQEANDQLIKENKELNQQI